MQALFVQQFPPINTHSHVFTQARIIMSFSKTFHFAGRVFFGDTDAAGVVYHGRYLNFLEAARIVLLDDIGYPYADLIQEGVGLSPVDIQLSYHTPLRFNDHFQIKTKLETLSGASFILRCQILKDETLACTATVKLACIDETKWKPRRLPEKLVTLIKEKAA